jgi:D-alanyl-D-alanine carboxypeptidase
MINWKRVGFFFLVFIFLPVFASAWEKPHGRLNLKAALLVDITSGKILYKQNADKLIQPASLAKILVLYLVKEDIRAGKVNLGDMVKISAKAVNTNSSSKMLSEGEEVRLEDLIKIMAILSANDATVAIAEHLAGNVDKFVTRMNAKAKELGMKQSHFVNPHGLSDKHQFSTARDIFILSRDYIQRFPDSINIHSTQYFTYNSVTYHNTNTLLQENGDVDGLKTGYVRAAGYHLVATAKRGDKRLMSVVLGAKNPKIRTSQTKKLLDFGFRMIGEKDQSSRVRA